MSEQEPRWYVDKEGILCDRYGQIDGERAHQVCGWLLGLESRLAAALAAKEEAERNEEKACIELATALDQAESWKGLYELWCTRFKAEDAARSASDTALAASEARAAALEDKLAIAVKALRNAACYGCQDERPFTPDGKRHIAPNGYDSKCLALDDPALTAIAAKTGSEDP